jgi:general secretion pathway protein D
MHSKLKVIAMFLAGAAAIAAQPVPVPVPPGPQPPRFATGAAPPQGAQLTQTPQQAPGITVNVGGLSLHNASLTEVIDQLARQLHLNYEIDPAVAKAGVTLNTYGDPKSLDARNLLEQILRINGLGMAESGGVYRIVPFKDTMHEPIPIQHETNGKNIPEDEQIMLNAVFLKYVSVDELYKILENFISENAHMVVYAPANLLFILDSRRNMRRTMELINEFDNDTFINQRVHIFEVHNARPSDLVKELDNILKSISLDPKTATVRFLPVDRINELIAVAPNPGVFTTIDQWLGKLDVPVKITAGAVENYVYHVKYGQAPCLAYALGQLFGNSAPGASAGYAGGFGAQPYGYGAGATGYGGYGGYGASPGSPYGGGIGGAGGYGGYGGYGGGMAGFNGYANPGGYGNATSFSPGFGGQGACGTGFGGGYGSQPYGTPAFGGYSAQTPPGYGVPGIGATGQTAGSAPNTSYPGAAGGVAQQPGSAPEVVRPPRIVPNPLDNALLIQADAQQYQSILKMLKELDIPPRQILLEAKIMEVDLTDQFASGITVALQQTAAGTFLPATASLGATGIGTFSIGTMVGGARQLLAALSLNENRTHVKTVSEPSLIATDSIPATITVGAQVPVSTGTTVIPSGGNTVTTQSLSSENTGVTLQVSARVTPSGVVTLYIGQQISSIDSAINTGTGSPAFSQQVVQTQITLMDGDTVAIGGTINDSVTDTVNGIPGLIRIPYIGGLFGSKTRQHARTELIMFMTPHVILDETNLIEASDELKSQVKMLRKYIRGL